MPTPCYISITGQTQGNITAGAFTADSVGNIYVQGHEDEMLVQEFLHNVTVPTDPQSGQPAGQRAHKPFIFTVALNKAVPLMYNALASGEMLPTTELHWWRTSVEGKQEHYFTTRLTDSTIVDMKLHMPHCQEVLYTEGEGGLKRVVKKEHADGSITRSEYDEAGRLKAQTDAAGRRTEYSLHMASGAVTAVTGPDGRTVRYGYNSQRQVTSVTYPDGLRSSREYDEKGRLTAETSRSGETMRYSYDDPASELPTGIEDATGSTKQMAWSRYGQLLAFTDCSGYTTRYEYDRYGQQIAVHREEGISTYSSYNPRGQLVSQKDAQGRETRYEYSAAGDLTAIVAPDGSRSEIQYDAWGKAVSTTQGGLTRSMGYDAAGRITVLTNENGSQSTFRYDPVDRLTEQRGFDGRTQRYHYDLTGKLTQSEDEGLITISANLRVVVLRLI